MNTENEARELVTGLLRRMPQPAGSSFSAEQLDALAKALRPAVHPVDIRRTLGFGRLRFYFVLLIGRERRSPQRQEDERARRPLWTLPNIATLAAFALFLLLSVIGLGGVIAGGGVPN